MKNHLANQTSPYLLQHAENPVHWYPWCEEAFAEAKAQDKPVFLSIGYSTCHWCHVMAHESFEDAQVAALLNEHFVSIKVDKEERPDIDSIYMAVCQAWTGSGGWPTSIFMTPDQKPFFAGTYFPKTARHGAVGFIDLLHAMHNRWETNRSALLDSAQEIISFLQKETPIDGEMDVQLLDAAVALHKQLYDEKFGGFGSAPKFPMPHDLLFLMRHFQKHGDTQALKMAEKTLQQLYRGGIFDHIGYGFSRYSTDRYFLVPHFEKMLYDNALLLLSYCTAYSVTKKSFFKEVAEKVATYIAREMTGPNGGFYSAQDADSDGVEGKYYVFQPSEPTALLGEETGAAFNRYYDITEGGNFEGKSIPNLLKQRDLHEDFQQYLPLVYRYRKSRTQLHLDDKLLTAWNALMIAALSSLYRVSGARQYLESAKKAQRFLENALCENDTLFVSFRNGKRGEKGFLDDYAFYIFALLALYEATFHPPYLEKARRLCDKTLADFYDMENGGFYTYGKENQQLILRRKETFDGAIPSGNSVMAYNLVRIFQITGDKALEGALQRQLAFLSRAAQQYPAGYSFFLMALSDFIDPPQKIAVVPQDDQDLRDLACHIPLGAVALLQQPTPEYKLLSGRTTFYVCKGHTCLPPTNALEDDSNPRA